MDQLSNRSNVVRKQLWAWPPPFLLCIWVRLWTDSFGIVSGRWPALLSCSYSRMATHEVRAATKQVESSVEQDIPSLKQILVQVWATGRQSLVFIVMESFVPTYCRWLQSCLRIVVGFKGSLGSSLWINCVTPRDAEHALSVCTVHTYIPTFSLEGRGVKEAGSTCINKENFRQIKVAIYTGCICIPPQLYRPEVVGYAENAGTIHGSFHVLRTVLLVCRL